MHASPAGIARFSLGSGVSGAWRTFLRGCTFTILGRTHHHRRVAQRYSEFGSPGDEKNPPSKTEGGARRSKGEPPNVLSGAEAGSCYLLVGFELVGEIRNGDTEGLRVVVGAVAGALGGAERTGDVVIGVSDVGAMLGIERDLEEVGE
jgi:hypothetical protein